MRQKPRTIGISQISQRVLLIVMPKASKSKLPPSGVTQSLLKGEGAEKRLAEGSKQTSANCKTKKRTEPRAVPVLSDKAQNAEDPDSVAPGDEEGVKCTVAHTVSKVSTAGTSALPAKGEGVPVEAPWIKNETGKGEASVSTPPSPC
ncbi:hypothetical protein GYMLUDRAFT_64034 [Collybiopsis luxurians FD-317 M1]|uniref:Uncharacterized protein n=1 Tax=Collybiopsis luxurians FD-317 M1 TaxID=944289 RepID=A0A0D0BT25_9AGAR|nr:hypothetical protein GYMLUDRAFT_64034 [Collybiopsis luxurians FD-317 M1]